jgi:hypothetical protein
MKDAYGKAGGCCSSTLPKLVSRGQRSVQGARLERDGLAASGCRESAAASHVCVIMVDRTMSRALLWIRLLGVFDGTDSRLDRRRGAGRRNTSNDRVI